MQLPSLGDDRLKFTRIDKRPDGKGFFEIGGSPSACANARLERNRACARHHRGSQRQVLSLHQEQKRRRTIPSSQEPGRPVPDDLREPK